MNATRKILFVDRDGCLIVEPPDEQIDSYDKLDLLPGVVAALQRFVAAGYELVMVTNQDGLGTDGFPEEHFRGPHELLMRILASQGIRFREVLIDRSFPHEGRDTRKPGTGLLRHYLADDGWSRAASAMVGDRETDLQFAANLGVRGFRVGPQGIGWAEVAHRVLDAPRIASVQRNTRETRISVRVDLDQAAEPRVRTGLGFFDHMLEQIGKHGGFALELDCDGDIHIDEHHTIEDCALALGQALRQALGDKRGIGRYGFSPDDLPLQETQASGRLGFTLPMDESRASAALDLSGRPYFVFEGRFPRERVGEVPTELVPHFFRSLCETLGANLHLSVRGENAHHMVEGCFKAVARALRQAIRREGSELPSTKGAL
ncbi:bifunctional histidinol-phosphatase/imidazoleglycerol-phosphate dehydratase HisB [Fulvimonas soli]|jgi:imidazoleglycerol-phosphate dehydratase/histidinol-phosphatase|uniref:Histidine biosynthesis bifunctional protein HisB n=1 Tax=Fulvimonas soli TaxID=155197 RepID=A0A316IKB5_9GAMM|nr:bifunctional histidinol-phosphatase/imidazoleglycerol-phosphate dehydratase HisB [Fulvimonas soli]PWK92954.1 imidazoleglycerol-phosphate dehydratase [Fulvimonas soli]TNY26566.1 bifunctional imidazole glycerol-phosphate dehydratase/histidinol phosphatase [Fulvimonas soli]